MSQSSTGERPWWRRKRWLALLALLLLGWFAAKTYTANKAYANVLRLQGELETPNLSSERRQEIFRDLRTTMNTLTPAQRQQLFHEQQKRSEAELDRYFAMSKSDQRKYMDEKLNSMQKRMQSGNAGVNFMPPPGGGPKSNAGQGQSKSPDEIEAMKKKRLDNSSPDMRAKRDRFRSDMEKRAKERGITMPTFGSGGPRGR